MTGWMAYQQSIALEHRATNLMTLKQCTFIVTVSVGQEEPGHKFPGFAA